MVIVEKEILILDLMLNLILDLMLNLILILDLILDLSLIFNLVIKLNVNKLEVLSYKILFLIVNEKKVKVEISKEVLFKIGDFLFVVGVIVGFLLISLSWFVFRKK